MRASILFSTFLLWASAAMASGTTIGNGGDEIRFKFEAARSEAIQRISDLKICSFKNEPENIKNWILTNQIALAEDIRLSRHQWTTDAKPTCGWTLLDHNADIMLSYPRCEKNIALIDAVKLLIHESVHHFGITDESFADNVALSVTEALPGLVCGKTILPEATKWQIKDRLIQILPPNFSGDSYYYGTYKDTGAACTVLVQTGQVQNVGPVHLSLDAFTISILNERLVPNSGESDTGISLTVLANIQGSPYLPGFVTSYSDAQNILSMDYIEKYLNQKWTASTVQVNYQNPDQTEVTIISKNNPVSPISKTCLLSF